VLSAKSLSDIIGTDTETAVKEAISGFACKDKDVENFLKQKAFEFEKRDKSRTYLIVDQSRYVAGEFVLLGYFTLSLKGLEFRDTVSKSQIRNIDGFSKEVKGIAILLIGQFGKDEVAASDVSGIELFNLCIEVAYKVQDLAGGRYALIECRDIEKVKNFYFANGFTLLQTDKNDSYLQMVRRL